MPIDIIKLDKSFIHSSANGPSQPDNLGTSEILIRNLAILASELNLDVVAEGLETSVTRDIYKAMGVRLGQGYLFSKPMPVQDVAEWLTANSEYNLQTSFSDLKKVSA